MELELELGLALPIHTQIKGFDLNKYWFEPEQEMVSSNFCHFASKNHQKGKRYFAETFENGGQQNETFPLVSWNDKPNEEDDGNGPENIASDTINNNDEEKNLLVGWPPVKSWRRKLLQEHRGGQIANDQVLVRGGGRTNSIYVKVRMEGVGIGRKIDLKLYHSYQTLTDTLISMFAKYQKIDEDGASYTILYQDREGDWLLARDVPWQTFIESVQRMEILRITG